MEKNLIRPRFVMGKFYLLLEICDTDDSGASLLDNDTDYISIKCLIQVSFMLANHSYIYTYMRERERETLCEHTTIDVYNIIV